MKFILLAAAAVIASPVIAQSTSTPSGSDTSTMQSTPQSDPAMQQTTPQQTDPSMQQAPATDATAPAQSDPSMQQQAPMQPMQQQPMQSGTQTTGDSSMGDPAGGYQPSQPAISGAQQPGATVRFQPAQSPDQAYPAPAPMASYPVCKKGQYDNCREAGGGARKSTRRSRR